MEIVIAVDGTEHRLDVEPRVTLADALRDGCGATSVHVGCEQGVCGACTVLVDGTAVRSCLLLAVQCDGRPVSTVASLSAPDGDLHPLQRAFSEHHALQCGFCTPGFVVLIAAALRDNPDLGDEELLDLVSSNICRCTGYEGILAAAQAARATAPRSPGLGADLGGTSTS